MPAAIIELSNVIIPNAFHGTDIASAQSIVNSTFKLSKGTGHYFGKGAYFFDSSRWHAEQWAARHVADPSKRAVIQAVVNLGYCLDLLNEAHKLYVQQVAGEIMQRFPHRELEMGAVVNTIASVTQVDTVRGIYIPKDARPIYRSSQFSMGVHVMIAVRKPSNISNARIV